MIETTLSRETVSLERAAVVAEARTWLNTPFHHDQRLKGVGVDCAQLLIAVYGAVGLVPEFAAGYYAQDWFLHQTAETLRSRVAEFCIPTDDPKPGDIMLFRFGRAESHGAIVVDFPKVIHADRMAGFVTEDLAGPFSSLATRIAGCWTLKRWAGDHV